jgi:hypothetical protein
MLVLTPQPYELLPPSPSSVNSVKGGGGVMARSGPQTDKHLPQSPFTGIF